jgi:hypothetical protein
MYYPPLFVLYTLELEDGKWFVGTTRCPQICLLQHRSGKGHKWTRLHPPVGGFSQRYPLKLLSRKCCNDRVRLQEEDARVRLIMLDHGFDNVRGGSFLSP